MSTTNVHAWSHFQQMLCSRPILSKSVASPNPGGALTQKGGMGMCRGHDPFFFRPPGAPVPTNLPSLRRSNAPIFKFLKNFPFSALFWSKFQLSRRKFSNFLFPRPLIFQGKSRSLDPTFGNPCGTHPPKKKS